MAKTILKLHSSIFTLYSHSTLKKPCTSTVHTKRQLKNYTNYIYKKIISLPVPSSKQDSFIKIWQQTLC